eukprot:TRINITY_DN2465_c0_g1_i3.p1 TRINITY_DN2465_c0_g1~~TRINITY_DN2465_c0_g1_i3.p1  ORF type:complete len:605 (+),score=80.75 TRINITY_DN2465_c0_g1_i3:105-1919(+)
MLRHFLILAACLQLSRSARVGDGGSLVNVDQLDEIQSHGDHVVKNPYATEPGECTEIQVIRGTTFYYPTRGIYVAAGRSGGQPLYKRQDGKSWLWYDPDPDPDGGPGWNAGEESEFTGTTTIRCYGDLPAANIDEYDWANDCKGFSFRSKFEHETGIEFRCLQRNPLKPIPKCWTLKTKEECLAAPKLTRLAMRLGVEPEARCWWGFGDKEDQENPEERCHARQCEEVLVHRNGVSQQMRTGSFKTEKNEEGEAITYRVRPMYFGKMYSVFWSDSCFEEEMQKKTNDNCQGWHVGEHAIPGKREYETTGISCYDNVKEPMEVDPLTCRTKDGWLGMGGWSDDLSVRFFCTKRDHSDHEVRFIDKVFLLWSQPGGLLMGAVKLMGRAISRAWKAMKKWGNGAVEAAKTCLSFGKVEHRGRACWSLVKKVVTIGFIAAAIACGLTPCAVVAASGTTVLGIAGAVWGVIKTVADTAIEWKARGGVDHALSWYAVGMTATGMVISAASHGAVNVQGETIGHALTTVGIDPNDVLGMTYKEDTMEGRLQRLMKECSLTKQATEQPWNQIFMHPDKELLKKAFEHKDIPATEHPTCADIKNKADMLGIDY